MKPLNSFSISDESAARHIETHSKSRSIINKKPTFNFHTAVILPIAWLLAFSGCSSIESTVENHRGTMNLLKSIEQKHEKPENPRVHPGQPYDRNPSASREITMSQIRELKRV